LCAFAAQGDHKMIGDEDHMKRRNKIAALAMALVLAVGLASCGSPSSPAPAAPAEPAPTGDTAPATRPVLKVGMECGYAPYNWTQPTDANGAVPIADSSDFAYGYDVMMAIKLADAIGYDLQIVKTDWDSLPMAVQSGKIDCAIAGQSITAKRLQTIDFTVPYYYASVVALTRKDTPYASAKSYTDLAGATMSSQLNTIWYDVLEQVPDANILPAMETAPAMLLALNSGKLDAVVTDLPTAKAALIAYPDFVLLDFEGGTGFTVSDEDVNIGISVQKGNSELADKLNAVLEAMTVKDFEAMMDEAIAVQPLAQ
jgi:putative lysine transport system substrate-binding protein